MRNSEGNWVSLETEIKSLVKDHFFSLFKFDENRDFSHLISLVPHLISQDMNVVLCKEVTNAEIWKAVKQLGPLKAHGKDGFSCFFFRKYWDIVGVQVSSAVKEFFTSNIMSSSLNITQVVLIPKIPNPEDLGKFRPISLRSFVHRIISKNLANRLKPIMKIWSLWNSQLLFRLTNPGL